MNENANETTAAEDFLASLSDSARDAVVREQVNLELVTLRSQVQHLSNRVAELTVELAAVKSEE